MKTPRKKSPLKAPPLRVAGESVDTQLADHIFEKFMWAETCRA